MISASLQPLGPANPGRFASAAIDPRDAPIGILYMGELRDRTPPVAAAKFAAGISTVLAERCDVC